MDVECDDERVVTFEVADDGVEGVDGRRGGMSDKSVDKMGDEHDKWDIRDQSDACHDAAAESPRTGICE